MLKPEAKHICIVTQSHLCRNPRVLKEAVTLASVYKVTIITSIFSANFFEQDQALISRYPNICLRIVSDLTKANMQAFTDRSLKKAGSLLNRWFNINSALALGYGAGRYYKACHSANADLYLCHQELATHIGTKLMAAGYKAGFNIEDWYSADLLPEAQRERSLKLLRRAEADALKSAICYTTSNALAHQLAETYKAQKPQVIYNVFPSRPDLLAVPKTCGSPLKLFWFSQTIGPGRGLESFIALLQYIHTPLQLHLLGDITDEYTRHLKNLMPQQHSLTLHGPVNEQDLAATIAQFDIGLALEKDTPPSRDYTITNKFFQYLQAGLPVIATRTEGQQEAFEKFTPGFMLSQQPNAAEIEELCQWLNNPAQLQAARLKAIAAAGVYNWENESVKLLKIISTALEG